jgi:hypothetical protein
MKHLVAACIAMLAMTCSGTVIGPSAARADPEPPGPDTPCAEGVAGALTQLPDHKTLVRCQKQQDNDFGWQIFTAPYPNSNRWLTYGPQLILLGEGQPNREIDSGDWIAYPQVAEGQCTAEQQAVVRAGELSSPQISTGERGQPLQLQLLPLLFTVELTGPCLWQKVQ